MKNISIPEVNMLKNSSTPVVSVPINLSIKLGFVSVNGTQGNLLCERATYVSMIISTQESAVVQQPVFHVVVNKYRLMTYFLVYYILCFFYASY